MSNYLITSTEEDIEGISRCHLQCFKNSLSSKLGIAYTKKTFEWFLNNDHRFLFHITIDGEVAGYCGGFIPRYIGDGSTSNIMQYTIRQAFIGIIFHPWLIFQKDVIGLYPLIFRNVKKKIFKRGRSSVALQPVTAIDKRVGLVVIGVHPQHRGSGLFQRLMHEFEAKALLHQIHKLVLSVKKDNVRAIKAYTKQGWFIIKEHAQTLEMIKYI